MKKFNVYNNNNYYRALFYIIILLLFITRGIDTYEVAPRTIPLFAKKDNIASSLLLPLI